MESQTSDPRPSQGSFVVAKSGRKPQARQVSGDGPEYDPQCLADLLRIVGQDRAPMLLAQLCTDFGQIQEALGPAAEGRVWSDLRRSSHNLIALSGTVGASVLANQARDLNLACTAEDDAAMAACLADVVPRTARLIGQLQVLGIGQTVTPWHGTRQSVARQPMSRQPMSGTARP